jgi:catechol 2,3-dioxygenase-like lactoylglutathione lyase family enzyme
MPIALTLLVLRCADIEVSKRFYEALGLTFVAEKHGTGPQHWSSTIGGAVLELYPSGQRGPTIARMGFCVDDVVSAMASAVRSGGTVPPNGKTASSEEAVVIDPDGNTIELVLAQKP